MARDADLPRHHLWNRDGDSNAYRRSHSARFMVTFFKGTWRNSALFRAALRRTVRAASVVFLGRRAARYARELRPHAPARALRAHVSTRYAHARGTRFPKMNAVGLLGLNERPRCLVLTTLTSRDATHPPKIIPEAESTVASTTAGARVRSQVSRCERLCVSPRRYCLSYSHIDPSSSHSSFHNAQLASMTSNDVLRRASATSRSASCTST